MVPQHTLLLLKLKRKDLVRFNFKHFVKQMSFTCHLHACIIYTLKNIFMISKTKRETTPSYSFKQELWIRIKIKSSIFHFNKVLVESIGMCLISLLKLKFKMLSLCSCELKNPVCQITTTKMISLLLLKPLHGGDSLMTYSSLTVHFFLCRHEHPLHPLCTSHRAWNIIAAVVLCSAQLSDQQKQNWGRWILLE